MFAEAGPGATLITFEQPVWRDFREKKLDGNKAVQSRGLSLV
jgi:hypothetical protein